MIRVGGNRYRNSGSAQHVQPGAAFPTRGVRAAVSGSGSSVQQ